MTAGVPRPITVVVPVYGDEASLRDCVESLRLTVDQAVHDVLFVNDVGPDADPIERYLLEVVSKETSFRYERNERNLGFVETCNRAATQLDLSSNDLLFLNSDSITTAGFLEELSFVLHSSPTHAAVCPRSNNATIASLPFARRDPSAPRSMARTEQVHAALTDVLPRYSVSPVAMGFCILIRRELIRDHGLFDPAFSPGYGEENDFCLRLAQHGYLSLIAHHALVFHLGGRSFGGIRREVLRSRHEALLGRRYPEYARQVATYLGRDRDAADVFADVLVPLGGAFRMLIDLGDATSLDAAAEHLIAIGVHAAGDAELAPPVEITVLARGRVRRRIARRFAVAVTAAAPIDRVWDVGVVLATGLSFAATARLTRSCLRWVVVGDAESAASNLADARVEVDDAPARLLDAIREWGTLPVDLEAVRSRWSTVTQDPRYPAELIVRRSRRERAARSVGSRAPGTVAVARAVIRRLRAPR